MVQEISANQTLIVVQRDPIASLDLEVLNKLYQPLIHASGLALYQAFLASIKAGMYVSDSLRHRDFIERMVISYDIFFQSRLRLEALGLLRTYQASRRGNAQQLRYDLYAPLSAQDFFKDAILRTLLIDRLGLAVVEDLANHFAIDLPAAVASQAWQEITRKFTDIYPLKGQLHAELKNQGQLLGASEAEQPQLALFEKRLDWGFLELLLADSLMPKRVLTGQVREQLETLFALYGFDERKLYQLLLDAYSVSEQSISLEQLSHKAAQLARNENQQIRDHLEYKVANTTTKERADEKEASLAQLGLPKETEEIIQACEVLTPYAFISALKQQKKGKVLGSEQDILTSLLTRFNLPTGVINLLIYYYLVTLNKTHLNWTSVERTADDWAQAGIQSPLAAINFIQNRREKARALDEKKQKSRIRYQEKAPVWLKNQQKTVKEVATELSDQPHKDPKDKAALVAFRQRLARRNTGVDKE